MSRAAADRHYGSSADACAGGAANYGALGSATETIRRFSGFIALAIDREQGRQRLAAGMHPTRGDLVFIVRAGLKSAIAQALTAVLLRHAEPGPMTTLSAASARNQSA